MSSKIPNSAIGAASSVLAAYSYSHSMLNSLFIECGVPGGAPEGNCEMGVSGSRSGGIDR